MNQIYINAEGYVTPCCWIGDAHEMVDYRLFHKGHFESLSIQNRDLEEILNDTRYKKIEASWSTDSPYSFCQKVCSKPLPAKNSAQGQNKIQQISLSNK